MPVALLKAPGGEKPRDESHGHRTSTDSAGDGGKALIARSVGTDQERSCAGHARAATSPTAMTFKRGEEEE
jgi:hypothetical protein